MASHDEEGYLIYPPPVKHFGRFYTRDVDSLYRMSTGERHNRLREARLHAGLERQRDVYERFPSWNRNTYKSNENGNAPFSFEQAKTYAKAFGVRAEWLYDGAGPMVAARQAKPVGDVQSVPVISWVAAGALGDPDTQLPAGDETLDISDLGAGEFFATRVRGDSMDRLAPEDSLLIVNRRDVDLVRGRRYIFSLRGKTTFKRYGEDPIRLDPESLNPAHEPHFIKPTDKWSVIGRVRKVIIDV